MDRPAEPDDTRVRLLKAAEAVFAEQGYAAATTREICRRAGVKNVGAVNDYFRGKERLYAEAVKSATRTCTPGAPSPAWPPGTPPARKLRDFIRPMMARMLEIPKPAAMTLMMGEMTRFSPSAVTVEAVEENIRPMAAVLIGILDELLPDLPFDRRILRPLKAMGTSYTRIVGMIVVQGLLVGVVGYGLGGTALVFQLTQSAIPLKSFHVIWPVMALTAGVVGVIVVLASLLSIRKVLALEPGVVFR